MNIMPYVAKLLIIAMITAVIILTIIFFLSEDFGGTPIVYAPTNAF